MLSAKHRKARAFGLKIKRRRDRFRSCGGTLARKAPPPPTPAGVVVHVSSVHSIEYRFRPIVEARDPGETNSAKDAGDIDRRIDSLIQRRFDA